MAKNTELTVTSAVVSFLLAAICCPVLAETPWSFIVTGDSRDGVNGVNTVILGELAGQIVNQGVDFVLFPGDLVTGSTDPAVLQSQLATWRNTMQPVYDAGIDVYPVRGNHDAGSLSAWNNVFSGPFALPANGPAGEENLTYSVTHKNALILGLDQYVTSGRVNQAWIDGQLAATTSPHVFAFGHLPAFAAQHTDCLDDYPANRDAFWLSLEQAGARTYFAGHDHFYDHAGVDGDGDPNNDIHQYIVGTAGAPLRDWSPPYTGVNSGMTLTQIYHEKQYGYLLGEVDGLDVTLTWMARVGADTYAAGEVWSYTSEYPTPLPALASSDPVADGTLAKMQNNVILLTFDAAIALPDGGAPALSIFGGGWEEGDAFAYSVEPDGVTLRAVEEGPMLTDLTWYQIAPAAGFMVQPFTLDVCTLFGDANSNGRVTTADYSEVKAHMAEYTDAPYDLNGSGRVTTADYSVVKSHMANRSPAKP